MTVAERAIELTVKEIMRRAEEVILGGLKENLPLGPRKSFGMGIDVGVPVGRVVSQKEIAKRMLAANFEPSNVAELTGLALDVIESLQKTGELPIY